MHDKKFYSHFELSFAENLSSLLAAFQFRDLKELLVKLWMMLDILQMFIDR